jgi:hypothetical protein
VGCVWWVWCVCGGVFVCVVVPYKGRVNH